LTFARERRDADLERRQKYLDLKKAKYRQDLAIGKRKKIAQMSKRQKRTMGRRWRQQNQDPKERKQMLENLVTMVKFFLAKSL
jgi:predicted ArsR family transcriptional regulator